jgi:hypothetical protein
MGKSCGLAVHKPWLNFVEIWELRLHLSIGSPFAISMTVLWIVTGVLLEVICAMGNDRVIFTEVPISVSNQDMEEYHKTARTHFHKISGKVVFCFRLYECTNVRYFNRTELCENAFLNSKFKKTKDNATSCGSQKLDIN